MSVCGSPAKFGLLACMAAQIIVSGEASELVFVVILVVCADVFACVSAAHLLHLFIVGGHVLLQALASCRSLGKPVLLGQPMFGIAFACGLWMVLAF